MKMVLQHLIETMSVKNIVRFVGKINEVMYDQEIANLHGGFNVVIHAHHQKVDPKPVEEECTN